VLLHMGYICCIQEKTRILAVLSFLGIVCGLISWGYWCVCVCVCVAVSSWVCRSIVGRFVRLVSQAPGVWCLGLCISLVGGFFTCRCTGCYLGGLLLLLKDGLV